MNENAIVKFVKVLVLIGVVCIICTVLTYFIKGHIGFNRAIDPQVIGTFGDFIGGFAGTLFAIATTFLVWLTYNSQKTELKENGELLKKQRFEGTFFNLIKVQQDLKQQIRFNTSKAVTAYESPYGQTYNNLEGDHFFYFAAEDFDRLYTIREGLKEPRIKITAPLPIGFKLEEIPMEEPERRIKSRYKLFFDSYHTQLAHYFRHLYYIFTFIEQNEIEEIRNNSANEKVIKDKYAFYAKIVQAQMSSSELYLFFYNGICFTKMKRFIEKYGLVENHALEDLADRENHKNLFENNALKTRATILD